MLYRQHVSNDMIVVRDWEAPFSLSADVTPNTYFIYIYTETPSGAPSVYHLSTSSTPVLRLPGLYPSGPDLPGGPTPPPP